jgi:hypothetical protein
MASVCDTIDASTDSVGRSYAPKRNMDIVLDDIVRQSGSRYHPDVCRALQAPPVRAIIRNILDQGRKDAYYAAYSGLLMHIPAEEITWPNIQKLIRPAGPELPAAIGRLR